MIKKFMLAALAVCLGACASTPADSTAGNASDSAEEVCHWESGSRFGSKDRRVCRKVDAS